MTTWMKQSWRDALHSPFALLVAAIFVFAIWPAIFWGIISDRNAIIAKQKAAIAQAQVTAIQHQLALFSKSPFIRVTLDSIAVNDGPPIPPNGHAIFVHPCDILKLHRTAVVSEAMNVLIPRALDNSQGTGLPMLPGSEVFHIGVNYMTPVLQIPSNEPRHVWLAYSTGLTDMTRPAPSVQMQPFFVFILDAGQPLPKPGQHPLMVSDQHPAPQPNCPVFTNVPPASPP